ncbi:hypothetical protein CRYUN_Cryun24cG0120800 [Craigia yunnanensis]
MRETAKISKYGSVILISGSDFVTEVSQAPQDVRVVVILYKEGCHFVLCQSDPVLNDDQSGSDPSRKAVLEGVRRRFIEKVVTEHEEHDDEGSSSD